MIETRTATYIKSQVYWDLVGKFTETASVLNKKKTKIKKLKFWFTGKSTGSLRAVLHARRECNVKI